MAQRLVEMRLLKRHEGEKAGKIITVTRAHAGLLEAQAIAVRARPAHAKQKPITNRHTVTKGD